MIAAVKASITTGSMSLAASGSRFWILANGGTQGAPDTFNHTETYPALVCTDTTIPEGVVLVEADLYGAGGGGTVGGHGPIYAQQGLGGRIKAWLRATPEHVWRICVGGTGLNALGQGGFNGGGYGTDGAGGGMTSIYNLTTGEYLLIAGAGGCGGYSEAGTAGKGGDGGWPSGTQGSPNFFGAVGALPGTQSTGYQQFQGEFASPPSPGGRKIGGGGGWWGGFSSAGGPGPGAGGGSGYVNPTYGVMILHQTGVQSGDGAATLRWAA